MFVDNFKTFENDVAAVGEGGRPEGLASSEAACMRDRATKPVIGLEIHAQLRTRTKIFCGCSTDVRRAAEFAGLSGLSRAARRAAGPQPAGRRLRDQGGARARLRRAARVDLRAQELLLSGPAEGLSDLAVRAAAGARRRPRHHRGRRVEACRPDAHPHGRGRGKSLHEGFPDSDRRTYVDYNRSGVPLIEIVSEPDMRSAARGRRVLQPPARHPGVARRQRRQHGRGQPALRRQRLGAAGRARRRSAPRRK